MASLFDILGNSTLRDALGQLAGQARQGGVSAGGLGGLGNILGQLAGQAGSAARELGRSAPGGLGGLAGAGALGAILGQMMPRGAANMAGLAGIGAVAWHFYKKWASRQAAGDAGGQAASPAGSGWEDVFAGDAAQAAQAVADPAGMLLLRAMVFAARADGHMDAEERGRIEAMLRQMYPDQDVSPLVDDLSKEAIDPALLARQVQAPEQGEDLYRLSCLIVDVDNFMERSYLNGLAQALGLSEATRDALEREAEAAKRQLSAY